MGAYRVLKKDFCKFCVALFAFATADLFGLVQLDVVFIDHVSMQ